MVKRIKEKDAKKCIEFIREGIDFNFKTDTGYIMFVGGILSKLSGTDQYFFIHGRGWVKVEFYT